MESKTKEFRKCVAKHLLVLLNKQGKSKFSHILYNSLNCDPGFLLDVINELTSNKLVHKEGNFYSLYEYKKSTSPPLSNIFTRKAIKPGPKNYHSKYHSNLLKTILHSLPDASPVYSQWWFKEKVYTDLVNILLNYSKPRDRVAFLGAPTIGTFFSHFSQNRQCNILDIDEFVLKELSLQSPAKTEYIPYDATNPLNPELHKRFKLIFSDPPWSSKLLKTFFHRSCQMVAPEGKVLISFPQEFTRPTATEERFELINTAANHGFSLATIHHNFTEYSIPEFEFNAYKKKGIHLENTWRKGDLFVFVKNRSSDKPIEFENQTHQTYWQQFDLGKKRFFLKRDGKEEKGLPDIRKVPDLTSFAYPSTSSRSTAWRNASLVSTQNTIARAFGRSHLEMYFKNITQICKHKNLTNINVNLGETRNDVFIKLLDFLKNKRE